MTSTSIPLYHCIYLSIEAVSLFASIYFVFPFLTVMGDLGRQVPIDS